MGTGLLENITGDLEVPDHPLALQSMEDCLQEAHDLEGLRRDYPEVGWHTFEAWAATLDLSFLK